MHAVLVTQAAHVRLAGTCGVLAGHAAAASPAQCCRVADDILLPLVCVCVCVEMLLNRSAESVLV